MSPNRWQVFDGVQIPERLIAEEAQNHPSASAEDARRAAGHALAIRALLLDRARELGLQPEPEVEEDGREETPEEALIRAVLDAEVSVTVPGEAECRRVYEAQRSTFVSPSLTEASHILIAPDQDETAGWEAAYARAVELIEQLAIPQTRFAELARAHSDCPSGTLGGTLGQLGPGDLVTPVEAALNRLGPGRVSAEPVRSRYGWHILRLDRRSPGRELPFEAVREQIALNLESRAWVAAATRYVSDLAMAAREQGVPLRLMETGRTDDDHVSLGSLLSAAPRFAGRLEAWLDQSDPALAADIRRAAQAAAISFADLVTTEVSAFLARADDAAWTSLISATQGSEDPALGSVRIILKDRLQPATRTYTLIRRS